MDYGKQFIQPCVTDCYFSCDLRMISKVKPVVDDTGDRNDWFETWFDSPYYHILYKDRNEKEAEHFLDNLIGFIKPASGARILDVACGKGRHSVYLNKKGYDVTGFDLSAESIRYVSRFENERLTFYLHDMREVFRTNYFDLVLNLFSSFGYFSNRRDNIRALTANRIALKPDGSFVFDYINASIVRSRGNSSVVKRVDGIDFHIDKYMDGDFVRKRITFTDNGKNFTFEEQLVLAGRKEMEEHFLEAGLRPVHCFGNYNLEPFDESASERLILIASKQK